MNIYFYIIIFTMGTLFGSFLTLATYRIPLNKDITHEHSFCPKCKHKLGFLDLIPVFSYLFLKGKCRYCGKKISPRYFLFEIITGISFVFLAYALEINIFDINYVQLIELSLGILYLVFLLLVAGIDFENYKIDKKVLIFGVTVTFVNIMYQYISSTYFGYKYNLNRVMIYLIYLIILLILEVKLIKKTTKYDYSIDLIIIAIIMCLFTYEITTIFSIICCTLIIAFRILLNKMFSKERKVVNLPVACYLVCSNIIMFIVAYFFSYTII